MTAMTTNARAIAWLLVPDTRGGKILGHVLVVGLIVAAPVTVVASLATRAVLGLLASQNGSM